MTPRAVIVGLIGATLIACAGYSIQWHYGLDGPNAGALMPLGVLGPLVLAVLVVIPLLRAFRRTWAFAGQEVATVVVLMLAACSIPGHGLLNHFPQTLLLPSYWNSRDVGWQHAKLMSYVPHGLLVNDGEYDERLTEGFITSGRADKTRLLPVTAVPWAAWRGPVLNWLPLIALCGMASICLALVVHRQWSQREHLRYPIAEFIRGLTDRPPGAALAPVFHRRWFWIGLSAVMAFHLINGLHEWFPAYAIEIPRYFEFREILAKCPSVGLVPDGEGLVIVTFYPTVIAFAYFLSSEISLSLGISQFVYVFAGVTLTGLGVNLATDYDTGGPMGWYRAGAYLALGLVILYYGRRYYGEVLWSALTFRKPRSAEPWAVWAMRGFLAAAAGMVLYMADLGLAWTIALPAVLLIFLSFLGVSRISAETGLYFVQPGWQPLGILLGLMGGFALGPQGIIVLALVCIVLCMDQSQATMPYVLHALKVADDMSLRPARVGASSIGAYVILVALATPIVIYANYNSGATGETWSWWRAPAMPFTTAMPEVTALLNTDRLVDSVNLSPLERITPANLQPRPGMIAFALAGLAIMLLGSLVRLRVPGWPIHPVMFLVLGTWPMRAFGYSFLVGWAVKRAATKYGGGARYESLKPLMIGVIAGEIAAAAFWLGVSVLYYLFTRHAPPIHYSIFPA